MKLSFIDVSWLRLGGVRNLPDPERRRRGTVMRHSPDTGPDALYIYLKTADDTYDIFPIVPGRRDVVNIQDHPFGATGDGTTSDAAAITKAITAAGVGGVVWFPKPSVKYLIDAPLVPLNYQTWIGPGWGKPSATTGHLAVAAGYDDAIIKASATVNWFTLRGLSLRGVVTAGCKGIYAADAQNWHVADVALHGFGEQALQIAGGTAGVYERILASGALQVDGRTEYVGAVDIAANDARLVGIEATCSLSTYGSGFRAGIVYRGTNGFVCENIGETSEVGIVLTTTTVGETRAIGNRADLNLGHGWVITSPNNVFLGNWSYRNGRAADNTYDGFVVSGQGNDLSGNNRVQNLASDDGTAGKPRMRHGFSDTINAGAGSDAIANTYDRRTNRAEYIAGQQFNFTGTGKRIVRNDDRLSADNGDAAATLTPGLSAPVQQWATPLTANRAVTLSTISYAGATFRIVRTATATGAFSLNVGTGPLKALAVGQWCEVRYDGAAWLLTAAGSL